MAASRLIDERRGDRMNKTAIIEFVDTARSTLETLVRLRAYEYGVSDKEAEENVQVVNGKVLSNEERGQRDALIRAIKLAEDGQGFSHGFTAIMEEAAYTWFNRFIALRFMEVNGYLPSHTRVFSDENGSFNPQILKEATTVVIDGIDRVKISDFIQSHEMDNLYKYLVILQCNELSKPIPEMFERIADYSELLFPSGMLKKDSVIAKMVEDIPEEDWKDQVQIIGWMYQSYISQKKKEVFNAKKTVTKETIAAVTQLFTPDWIVRYMVENSIGRIWLESYPSSSIRNELQFFVDDEKQSDAVTQQFEAIRYKNVDPKEIKIIEPCCGSGHILVYCFDVLYKFYLEKGYSPRDIPSLILQNNLTGLDIDKRASQLAAFSLIMKARSYDSGFFRRGILPSIHEIIDTSSLDSSEVRDNLEKAGFSKTSADTASYLCDTFRNAKVIGSLLKVQQRNYQDFISEIKEKVSATQSIGLFEQNFYSNTLPELMVVADLASILSKKYDVMVTNPPYCAFGDISPDAQGYLETNYPHSRFDMFSMFMQTSFVKRNGYTAMINQQQWLNTITYKETRKDLLRTETFSSLLHLGSGAFEFISGSVVNTVTFVMRNCVVNSFSFKVFDLRESSDKENDFKLRKTKFSLLSADSILKKRDFIFEYNGKEFSSEYCDGMIIDHCPVLRGPSVPDNTYLRKWYEVKVSSIAEDFSQPRRWIFCTRNGNKVKWFDTIQDVIDKEELKKCSNYDSQSRFGVVWPDARFGDPLLVGKLKNADQAYESAVNLIQCSEGEAYTFLAAFNLGFFEDLLSSAISGQHFSPVYVKKLPYLKPIPEVAPEVKGILSSLESISKFDETNPRFENFFIGSTSLESSYAEFSSLIDSHLSDIASKEKVISDLFSKIMEIGRTSPKKMRYSKISKEEYAKRFLSYFVGTAFGRYSLDANGLAFAGDDFDLSKYTKQAPVKNDILPIGSDDYLSDDVVSSLVIFLKTVFGESSLESNLNFLSNALGKSGNPRDVLRQYFLNDFYYEHVKMYQKRPIYWLFNAGKKNSFKALVYLHRYSSDTLVSLRTDYILPLLDRYNSRVDYLVKEIPSFSGKESIAASKELESLRGKIQELSDYEAKIHHAVDQKIMIDLDDGVKANYGKLADVLEPIK
jgi:hypothetical protein